MRERPGEARPDRYRLSQGVGPPRQGMGLAPRLDLAEDSDVRAHDRATQGSRSMRTKAIFVMGFATGYVLGARAGRARYEQIRDAARAFASNPRVQSTASTLQHQAGDALTTAKDKASSSLSSTLQEKRPGW